MKDIMKNQADRKSLRVDYTKCTGCHLCEIACSLFNQGICNPALSKICVVSWEEASDFPMVCQQCDDAPCAAVCPAEARSRNEQTGAIDVDPEKCIGCRMCIYECPFGAILAQEQEETTTNCSLCEGDPRCVKVCDTEAIRFIPQSEESSALFEEAKEKFAEYKSVLA